MAVTTTVTVTVTATATAAAVSYLVAIRLPEDPVANNLPDPVPVTTVESKRGPQSTYPEGFSGDGLTYSFYEGKKGVEFESWR